MAKPRTNYETIDYWAASILANAPADPITVNSIIVRNDTVFSFGSHYPMGVIRRDSRGRAKAVILNSDFYPSRGFANTPGDQGDARTLARHYVLESPREIEVKFQLLSAYSTNGKIQTRPRPDDPEPPAITHTEVPRRFTAKYPGPEPVKDPHGCVAGHLQVNGVMETAWVKDVSELRRNDRPKLYTRVREDAPNRARGVVAYLKALERYDGLLGYPVMRPGVERIEWVEQTWPTPERRMPGWQQRRCPHCAAFEQRHSAWTSAMRGGYGVRGGGWLQYQSCLERYGGWDGWLQAWRRDRDRVRKARSERAAWDERNHMRFDYVPTKNGVPRTDPDGYPLRKDEDSYWKVSREAARMERRRQREAEARLRERRQIDKFILRMREQRGISFTEAASIAATTVRELREALQANDSQEVA